MSCISILFYKPINDSSIDVVVENNLNIEDEYTSFDTTYKNDSYKVYIYGSENIQYGDVITLNEIETNKINNTYNNPSSFNYEKYMLGNEIIYTISPSSYEIIGEKQNLYYKVKNKRQENITYNFNNVENYEYINALVYGENDFSDEDYNKFSELNILHALTISGSHLILIIGFLRFFFSIFKIQNRFIDFILLIFLPIYCILAGGAIPIIRATFLEISVILFKDKFSRKDMTIIAFILFTIFNPFIIFLVSFQLTFLISLLLFYIDHYITSTNNFIKSLQMSFWISYFILPITLNLNYEINFMSPIANLILVPMISFIILPLCFLIELSPLLTNIIPTLLNISIICFEKLTNFFSLFTITTGHIGPIFSMFIILIGILYGLKKEIHYQRIIFIFLFILPINYNIVGSVNFVDVGQGDCTMIELPMNQGIVVIDTGPIDAVDELESYLKYYGVRSIDMLFLTHEHADHIANASMLVEEFYVHHIYAPPSINNSEIETIQAGDVITYKGYEFHILHPDDVEENPNNNSLVLQINFGYKTFLFTGDIESKDEQYLIENYDVNSTVLKIPHHGSNTSSSTQFLEAVAPQTCVISVAEKNMYNHPNPLALERIEENCEVLQTSEKGEIKFRFIALRSH